MNKLLKIAIFISCLIALVFIICYVSHDKLMKEDSHFVQDNISKEIKEPKISWVLGDYDWEIRDSSGRVDVDKLVTQLKNASINTYAFLINHRETDYDDLKFFLSAAEKAEIDVWAYLAPPSECPPYSEPYKTDYIKWSSELAKLSLEYPNLKAMAIDDFNANMNFFTPDYVGEMRKASRSLNPKFLFMPVIYYAAIDDGLREAYGEYIDGVIFPYRDWPEGNVNSTKSELRQIRYASKRLKGNFSPNTFYSITYPSNAPSRPGDFAGITQTFKVPVDTIDPILRFKVRDNYISREDTTGRGYHFKQVLIEDNIVWEDDVAGDEGNLEVSINIKEFISKSNRTHVNLTIRVYEKNGVSNGPITVWWTNVSITNVSIYNPNFEEVGGWEYTEKNPFWRVNYIEIKPNDLALIVMIYAGGPGGATIGGVMPTTEYLRDAMINVHTTMEEGASDGIMTYCLYKGGENVNQTSYLYGGSNNKTYYDHYLLAKALYSNWSEDYKGNIRKKI